MKPMETMMELDELKSAWQTLDRHLERLLKIARG